MFLLNSRIPLVRSSSELAAGRCGSWYFRDGGAALAGARQPRRPFRGSRQPGPQSQSLSRGYGSILPTSLTYIVLSARGCSPWRPDAVVSTDGGRKTAAPPDFQGPSGAHRRPQRLRPYASPAPYLRLRRFQGGRLGVNERRELSPGPGRTSPIGSSIVAVLACLPVGKC